MQISAVDSSSYALYSPYDISAEESLIVNNNSSNVTNEGNSISSVTGVEPTATAVAINPIPPESIELQELQNDIISAYDEFKQGNISNEEFTNTIEDLGLRNTQNQVEELSQNETSQISQTQNNQALLELSSAFIESVSNNSQNDETQLSQYASLFDKINEETQSSQVKEQLQAYTQNLRY